MAYNVLIQIGIAVVLAVISYMLTPKPTSPADPATGKLESATVDLASDVPVLFGTRLVSKTNCIWFGDVSTTPIRKR
jgi:predicted phage tail protein